MSLQSEQFLKDAGEASPAFPEEVGWEGISSGLKLVGGGYCVLVLGSLLGPLLAWLALFGSGPSETAESRDSRGMLLLLAATTVLMTGVVSYGMVLAGQWRCLMHSPQRNSTKEIMYACYLCLLIGSALSVLGVYLDGGKIFAALQKGREGLEKLDPLSPANLVLIGSAVLGVGASFLFSQFLRGVADCLNDRRRARAVDFNLWFMGLLIGGSVGAQFFLRRLALRTEALPWLIAGWSVCFAWHLWLVLSVRRGVELSRRRPGRPGDAPVQAANVGAVATHTLSGLHRLMRNAGA